MIVILREDNEMTAAVIQVKNLKANKFKDQDKVSKILAFDFHSQNPRMKDPVSIVIQFSESPLPVEQEIYSVNEVGDLGRYFGKMDRMDLIIYLRVLKLKS